MWEGGGGGGEVPCVTCRAGLPGGVSGGVSGGKPLAWGATRGMVTSCTTTSHPSQTFLLTTQAGSN
jgi:hypothetical protein